MVIFIKAYIRWLCKTRIFGQDQGQRDFKTATHRLIILAYFLLPSAYFFLPAHHPPDGETTLPLKAPQHLPPSLTHCTLYPGSASTKTHRSTVI